MIPKRPLLIAALLFATVMPAAANTFVFSHLLETSGSLTQQPGTFDTFIHVTYPGPFTCAPGSGDNFVVVWAFNADGSPTIGGGGSLICAPCMFPIGATDPFLSIPILDLITAGGGFPPGEGFDTYLVVDVSGPDAPSIDVAYEIRAHVDSQSLPASVLFSPTPLPDLGTSSCKTLVFPHLLETSGGVQSAGNTVDTNIYVTYTAGQGEVGGAATGATVDIYLFDETTGAALLDDTGTTVCEPCSFLMGDGTISPRKRKISVDSLITAHGGGYPSDPLYAYAIIVLNGDTDQVNVTSAVVNARTGPGDLAVFVFEPQPIAAAASVAAEDVARLNASLRNHPNPFNPRTTLDFALPRDDRVKVRILDMRGRVVRDLLSAPLPAGDHQVVWDGRDDAGQELPSGVYLARLETTQFTRVEKMALLR